MMNDEQNERLRFLIQISKLCKFLTRARGYNIQM